MSFGEGNPWGGGATTGGGGGPVTAASIVWAPGVAGAAQTWSDVMSFFVGVQADQRVVVVCDDSGGALTIPAGSYNLLGQVWFQSARSPLLATPVVITIAANAEILHLAGTLPGSLKITSAPVAATVAIGYTTAATIGTVYFTEGTVLENTAVGGGSLIGIAAGLTLDIEVQGATFSGSAIVQLGAASTLNLFAKQGATVAGDWLVGPVGSTYNLSTDSEQAIDLRATVSFLGTVKLVSYFEYLPGWNVVADVYVDPGAGNNQNTGLSSTQALADIEEHYRRSGDQQLASGFTQTIHLPVGVFSAASWRLVTTSRTGVTTFRGSISDILGASGAITAGTTWDPATRAICSYTVPTVTFTGMQPGEYYARVVGGPRNGLVCPISYVASAHVFETPGGEDPTTPYTIIFPQIGDTIQVCQVTRLRPSPVTLNACVVGEVLVYNIALGDPGLTPHQTSFPAAVLSSPGSELHTCTTYGTDGQPGSLIYAFGSYVDGLRTYGQVYLYGAAVGGVLEARAGSFVDLEDAVLLYVPIQVGVETGYANVVVEVAACVTRYGFDSLVYSGGQIFMRGGSVLWFKDGVVGGVALTIRSGSFQAFAGAVYDVIGTAPPNFVSVGGTVFTLAAIQAAGSYLNPNNGSAFAAY